MVERGQTNVGFLTQFQHLSGPNIGAIYMLCLREGSEIPLNTTVLALSSEMTFKHICFPVLSLSTHISIVRLNHNGEIIISLEYTDLQRFPLSSLVPLCS